MKEIIEVARSGRDSSKIVIGNAITCLKSFLPEKKVFIITDANVHRRYKELINEYEYILIGMGETNKTLVTVDKIYRELIALGADRESFILGIGGGIVTDIAGYAASTYMRGISFGFVATTLLSQVDASIGGKNGVNVEGYKNMAGTFNQPDFVLCDTSMLSTLTDREFRSGLSEIIKAAVIADSALFSMLEQNSLEQLRNDEHLLQSAISSAIHVKASIVEADERETGERKKLNLGHTFAHAIEKHSTNHTHGEAVAVGLAMICDLSVRMGLLESDERNRIKSLLERMGLPLSANIEHKQLLKAIMMDKKRDRDIVNLIVVRSVGDCKILPIPYNELSSYF